MNKSNLTTVAKLRPNQVSNEEFTALHKEAITQYINSVWQLAAVLKLGKKKYGVEKLCKQSAFDRAKTKTLIALSDTPIKNTHLLPEHHLEVLSVINKKYWLDKAETERLTPSQLRALIREKHKTFKEEKNIKIAQWPKRLMLAVNEISKLPPHLKEAALRKIQELIK